MSAYALQILNNRHEYGTAEETLELLKPCNKRTRMNCWGSTLYASLLPTQHIDWRTVGQWCKPLIRTGTHVTRPTAHSLAQPGSEKYSRHTPARVSPINFDTIHYILFSNPYYCGTWRNVFHCRPDNMCSHTIRLTKMVYFNQLFYH